jgi:hypothetical protein
MPARRIDLARRITDCLRHSEPLPPEADSPWHHYERSVDDAWNLIRYIKSNLKKPGLRQSVVRQYLVQLHGMVLINLIQAFERFLKDIAAVCVDCLAEYVLDDRFNVFRIQGANVAAHFGADTLGKSLCESATWLDSDEINDRFRRLLADPFQKDGTFHLFPKSNQQPTSERGRFETLSIVWQLRHTMVHNVNVITRSDAIKLRLLAKAAVEPLRLLAPTQDDVRYLKRFLDETAKQSNDRIGQRLAELLTTIHTDNPILFAPQEMADRVTALFGFGVTIAGVTGTLPLP